MFIELFISPYVSILNFDMSGIESFPICFTLFDHLTRIFFFMNILMSYAKHIALKITQMYIEPI